MVLTSNVYALSPSIVSSTEVRNAIAHNWKYVERGYEDNNCLAWAVELNNIWLWPWGLESPTHAEVDNFMDTYENLSPTSSYISCDIYAYGTSSRIVHFARGRGTGPLAVPIDSKWGSYENFSHTTVSPYNSVANGGIYGALVRAYT